MAGERYHDREWLQERYWGDELSCSEIADRCDVTPSTIARWLRKLDIDTRSSGGMPRDLDYKDEEWLREQVEEQGNSVRSVADGQDVSESTIRKWVRKFGIETQSPDKAVPELTNPDWLREQYVDLNRSTVDIGDNVGCSATTVSKWLDRHGIEARNPSESARVSNLREAPHYHTDSYGYEEVRTTYGDERYLVKIHRLVAVAEYGFDTVCDQVVHHKNSISWDNRPQNLEVMDQSEHMSEHMREEYGDEPWRDESRLREVRQELTRAELAERWGVSYTTIRRWEERFGIEGVDDPHYDGPWRDEKTLREAYRDTTREELADRWGCSTTTIDNWLNRFGITNEGTSDGQQAGLGGF